MGKRLDAIKKDIESRTEIDFTKYRRPELISTFAEAVTAVNHAVTYYDPKARLDAGHSTNIMEKREKEVAAAGAPA